MIARNPLSLTSLGAALSLTLGLAGVSTSADAAVISVNIANDTGTSSSLATNETAGAVPADNWNNFVESSSAIALMDSGGASVNGATFYFDGAVFREAIYTDNNKEMMANTGNVFTSATVAGLPAAYTTPGYNVYVYFSNDAKQGNVWQGNLTPTGGSTITLFGEQRNPAYIATADGTPLKNATFTTAAAAAASDGGDYLLFENITASGFSLTGGYTGTPNGFAGLQIVPVPEPASLGLLTLGALLALPRRHKSC